MMMLPTVASSSTGTGSRMTRNGAAGTSLVARPEQGANPPGIRQGAGQDAGVLPFSRFLESKPRDFGHEARFLQYPEKAASGQKAGVA